MTGFLLLLLLAGAAAPTDPVLDALAQELDRSSKELKNPDGQHPYYLAYEIHDRRLVRMDASFGAILTVRRNRTRLLDVDVRVGDAKLDNSHELPGGEDRFRDRSVNLPIQDDPVALRQTVWRTTDQRFKEAVARLAKIKAGVAVEVAKRGEAGDFSLREPIVDIRPPIPLEDPGEQYAGILRRVSAVFAESRHLLDGRVSLDAHVTRCLFAGSDGSRLAYDLPSYRLVFYAATRAEDGMDLFRQDGYYARSLDGIPAEEVLMATARRLLGEVEALRKAPVIEPYSGPAILSGRAAAVFFHEIFGHRIEGHRQKRQDEGQTFTRKLGQEVLPPFLSVVDDPGEMRMGDQDLMGYYPYDDEGTPSQKAQVVAKGILKTFLTSRSPVAGVSRSNAHGRRQAGYPAVGRQGNLIVTSSLGLDDDALRRKLKALIRKSGKPFGLYFEDISGGYTFTRRALPQAYKVLPLMVYKVYPDEREAELVRGVDIVGTPLASFARIVAAGGPSQVFNGYCGAESGYIPVSATAPGILVSELEVEKQQQGKNRPPILSPPGFKSP